MDLWTLLIIFHVGKFEMQFHSAEACANAGSKIIQSIPAERRVMGAFCVNAFDGQVLVLDESRKNLTTEKCDAGHYQSWLC